MVKCPCGKRIIFKKWDVVDEEEEEDSTGLYAGSPKGFHGGRSSNGKTRKVRIYGCEDSMCMYTSDMTEDEYHKLEE